MLFFGLKLFALTVKAKIGVEQVITFVVVGSAEILQSTFCSSETASDKYMYAFYLQAAVLFHLQAASFCHHIQFTISQITKENTKTVCFVSLYACQ
jgi:hypothetical protein